MFTAKPVHTKLSSDPRAIYSRAHYEWSMRSGRASTEPLRGPSLTVTLAKLARDRLGPASSRGGAKRARLDALSEAPKRVHDAIHITARSRHGDALHMVREERRRAVAHAPVACAVARGLAARAPCEVRDEGQRAR